MAELDIAAFLRARYDERQLVLLNVGPARVAWATFRNSDRSMRYTSVVSANGDVWVCDGHVVEPDSVQVVFDRDQELADIAAKRQIAAMHERTIQFLSSREYCQKCATGDSCDECLDYETQVWPCSTLRLLALPYAGHPDYREDWKP